jgi:hypothetical protein
MTPTSPGGILLCMTGADDDVPEGFLFEVSSELSKAAPPPRPAATAPDDAQEAELARAARAVATPPAHLQHGRSAGAGNALAFHTWGKDPSSTPLHTPKKDETR